MDILIKYLSPEPVENLVTALHYSIGRFLFFGYPEVIEKVYKGVQSFLKKYCGAKSVSIQEIPENDLQGTLAVIKEVLEEAKKEGCSVYGDLTGARGMLPVVFGMLEKEYRLPLHMFDIETEKFIPLNKETIPPVSETAAGQNVRVELDRYIEMRGGIINYKMHKEIKGINDRETDEQIKKLWELFLKYEEDWPAISGIFQKITGNGRQTAAAEQNKTQGTGSSQQTAVSLSMYELRSALRKTPSLTEESFCGMLKDGEETGLFTDLKISGKSIKFAIINKMICGCLTDAGSILELQVYRVLRRTAPNSKVGVHLDWDGVIHSVSGLDVLNEIDVISLNGLVPTFISCKLGRANKTALYELSAVTNRFGGRYAKKILVTAKGMAKTDLRRAAEMGILVVDKEMVPYPAPEE